MLTERTQCILSNNDYERIGECLRRFPSSKIFVCYNRCPMPSLKTHVEKLELEIVNLLKNAYLTDNETSKFRECIKKRFSYFDNKEMENLRIDYETACVKWIPISYYSFDDAVVEFFELFYLEQIRNREVVIGINGGIRLVALAASFAANLLTNCHLVYFFAQQWDLSEMGEISSLLAGYEPVRINPIFKIDSIIPKEKESIEILLALKRKKGVSTSVKKIVRSIKEENKEDKSRVTKSDVAKYSNKLKKSVERGLIRREDNRIKLTQNGLLISKLLEKKIQIDEAMSEKKKSEIEIVLEDIKQWEDGEDVRS